MKQKIGIVAGAFDLFHAGHVLYLKEAKENCDKLIVFLQIDPSKERPEKNKPIQSLEERKIQLEGCKYVDTIKVYNTEANLYWMLKTGRPDIRFLGTDYKGKLFTGDDLPIPIHYCDRSHSYSSTELRRRISNEGD